MVEVYQFIFLQILHDIGFLNKGLYECKIPILKKEEFLKDSM